MLPRTVTLLVFLMLLTAIPARAQNGLPAVNQQVKAYATAHKGQEVGRGECWDLVRAALDDASADWTMPEGFGREYDPAQQAILPGDILRFKDATFKNRQEMWNFPQHYGIVLSTGEGDALTFIHQNFNGKRHVLTSTIHLGDLKHGTLQFFRPQPSAAGGERSERR